MEKDYVLQSGGLSVLFDVDPPQKLPLDYPELHLWLKSNLSRGIRSFNYWNYLVDGKEYQFKLKRGIGKTWHVYLLEKPDELYFSFGNPLGLELKEDFEKELRKALWEEE